MPPYRTWSRRHRLDLHAVVVVGISACAPNLPPAAGARVSGASTPTATTTVASARPAPMPPRIDAVLIPRETLFGNAGRDAPQISPDGKWVAFVAPVDGVLNVMVAPTSDVTKAEAATHDTSRPITAFVWTETPGVLMYEKDAGGDENFHQYAVRVPGGAPLDLTPYAGIRSELDGFSAKHPGEALIGMNDRDPKYLDVYRVSLRTGARTLVQKNEGGFRDFRFDDDFKPRLATKPTPDGGKQYLAPGPKKAFDEVYLTVPFEDAETTHLYPLDDSGKTLYLVDSRGRDKAALFAIDYATKKATLLAEDREADVESVLTHPRTHKPLAAIVDYDRRRSVVVDPAVKPDLDYLATLVPGADASLSSCSDDFRRCVARVVVSDGPTRYYLYDRTRRDATLLFADRPDLEGLKLSKMRATVIRARDDLRLVSYLTLPAGSDADGDGKPDRALPTVLLVHGGPYDRDVWGYDVVHQWLANRGYAVLTVNFRGSIGFGKSFVNASTSEWGGKMQEDLLDAVSWATANGISDPARVAIMGWSYGGYATLVGLTSTPDTFACGVEAFGPSNLVTEMENFPPYWASELETLRKRIGDFRSEEGRTFLLLRSPITRVDAIKRPLLIGQGANDARVGEAQSDQIVKSMQAKGIPVSYVLFSDEGHGFARPENTKAFVAVTETFLAQCLGGAYEPIRSDFSGSTIQVPAGAESVYGLAEALQTKR